MKKEITTVGAKKGLCRSILRKFDDFPDLRAKVTSIAGTEVLSRIYLDKSKKPPKSIDAVDLNTIVNNSNRNLIADAVVFLTSYAKTNVTAVEFASL